MSTLQKITPELGIVLSFVGVFFVVFIMFFIAYFNEITSNIQHTCNTYLTYKKTVKNTEEIKKNTEENTSV